MWLCGRGISCLLAFLLRGLLDDNLGDLRLLELNFFVLLPCKGLGGERLKGTTCSPWAVQVHGKGVLLEGGPVELVNGSLRLLWRKRRGGFESFALFCRIKKKPDYC